MEGNTIMFPLNNDEEINLRQTLFEVYQALAEKGYNPISQIVGYLISGDPTYITNHKNARTNITKLDRDELLKILIKFYLSN
jgi:Uncharacterized protein conserved in bacteria